MPNTEYYSKELCRVIEWCLQVDMAKRPNSGQLIGIPRVSNILKTIKLKNMTVQIQKISDKNKLIDAEVQQKKMAAIKLEQEVEQKRQVQKVIEEKIKELKNLKAEFEREMSRNHSNIVTNSN